jgi:hypothetical protein
LGCSLALAVVALAEHPLTAHAALAGHSLPKLFLANPGVPGIGYAGQSTSAGGASAGWTLAAYRSTRTAVEPLVDLVNEAHYQNIGQILRNMLVGSRGQVVRLTLTLVPIVTIAGLAVALTVAAPADLLALARRRLRRPTKPPEPRRGLQAVAVTPPSPHRRRSRYSMIVLRWLLRDGTVIFFVALAINLAAGYYLVFVDHFLPGDAQSRVADAFFVLFSRDPHLAAIGFIWLPLPSFLELAIVAFKSLWPELVTSGFAGSIQTAVCGAGSAAVLNAFLRQHEFRPPLRWLLVAAYILNPMVLLYNANGMSESMFVLVLLASTFLFLRWTETRKTSFLVGLATVTAIGIFVRYEMWLFALFMGLGVVAYSVRRIKHYRETETRAVLYALPVAYAAVLWLGLNLVIKRNALYFLGASYNTQSIGPGQGAFGPVLTWPAAAEVVLDKAINLYPAYFLWVPAVILVAIVARRVRAGLTLLLVSTAALLMQLELVHGGNSFLDLRYFITVIPFGFVFLAFALGHIRPWWLRLALAVPSLVILLASNAFTLITMDDPHYFDESQLVAAAIKGVPGPGNLQDARAIAEELHQVGGSSLVAMDTFTTFAIDLASPDPRRFVITSDRDFEAAIAEPYRHNVKYFVVPKPVDRGRQDRINQLYPGLWNNGAGFAVLERELGAGYRLYRLTSAPR